MARLFLTGNDVRLTSHDRIFVDAELYSGETYKNLEPRRLFPVTGGADFISFLDENGDEKFILRDIANLPTDQREILEKCLFEYYRVPKITSILKRNDNDQLWTWTVDTDRGVFTFEMTNTVQGFKQFYDGRILIIDSKDNRYEIPSIDSLDPKSQKIMQSIL